MVGEVNEHILDLVLPTWLDVGRLRRYLGRDPASCRQRLEGDVFRFAVEIGGEARAIVTRFAGRNVEVEVPGGAVREGVRDRLHRIFGLCLDPRPFELRARQDTEIARLIEGRHGLTIPQTHDLEDAVIWVIVGQQVSLASAFSIRRRLAQSFGRPVAGPGGEGLILEPNIERIAELREEDLCRRAGFSHRKAEYLLGVARATMSGELDLEALGRKPPTEVEAQLLALRGFGPWSVGYLMMRGYGLEDCVPVGDVALAESLRRFHGMEERPDKDGVRQLMEPYAPHRSLATFHFWNRLGDAQ